MDEDWCKCKYPWPGKLYDDNDKMCCWNGSCGRWIKPQEKPTILREYKVIFWDSFSSREREQIFKAHDAKDALTYAEFETKKHHAIKDNKFVTCLSIRSIEPIDKVV